jgi:DNA-directed RNA polymerase specialized sigma24 family protein
MAGGAHYVSNADFLVAMKEYRVKVLAAREAGLTKKEKGWPQVPHYVGECLLKIATHLSYKANFINYSYREDMISDGIENCLQYIDNFDPEKSNNPFSYFTQIIYYAFLRRIAKEKKQTYIKGKLIMDMPFEAFELQDQDDDGHFNNQFLEFIQQNQTFGNVDDFVQKKAKKKKKESTLDEFLGDEQA